jgi:hypothetical protein
MDIIPLAETKRISRKPIAIADVLTWPLIGALPFVALVIGVGFYLWRRSATATS